MSLCSRILLNIFCSSSSIANGVVIILFLEVTVGPPFPPRCGKIAILALSPASDARRFMRIVHGP